MFCPCSVMQFLVSFLFLNHLDKEERADCFTLTLFPTSCDCKCSVALSRGAVSWSAVCDCGISW